jgi:hypothetical protein
MVSVGASALTLCVSFSAFAASVRQADSAPALPLAHARRRASSVAFPRGPRERVTHPAHDPKRGVTEHQVNPPVSIPTLWMDDTKTEETMSQAPRSVRVAMQSREQEILACSSFSRQGALDPGLITRSGTRDRHRDEAGAKARLKGRALVARTCPTHHSHREENLDEPATHSSW